MKVKWAVPVLASILILGGFGLSQDAFSDLPPAPPGSPTIKITKDTIGGDGTFFFTIFNATNPASNTVLSIPDTSINDMTAPLAVQAGSYSVIETVPLSWNLISSDCLINGISQGSTFNFNLINGDTVECIFVNLSVLPDADGDGVPDADDQCPATPLGTPVDATGCPIPGPPGFTIKITKDTIGGDGSFDFNILNATDPADGIVVNIPDTSINSMTAPISAQPGSYSVTETVPLGWNLISSDCLINGEPLPPVPPIFPPLTFNTITGDTVECVFENEFTSTEDPPVGGTILPIDTTALLVAGAQTISPWLILGVVTAVGIGIAVFTLKRSR